MDRGEYEFVWQRPGWPSFEYDLAALAPRLLALGAAQGTLVGRMHEAGVLPRAQAHLSFLTDDVIKTSAIEGEVLNVASVRSSIARRLGVDIGVLAPADRHVEGVVDLVLDAISNARQPVTVQRLFAWHSALFPTGQSGLARITTGNWRHGPMQVVSGRLGNPRVHFEAPPADRVRREVDALVLWIESDTDLPAPIKAGIAHLWFLTVHPFEDGNGRVARALSDLLLARQDGMAAHFYSVSAQIQRERKAYYMMLEQTQRGGLEITGWLAWFLDILLAAAQQAHSVVDRVLSASNFWVAHAEIVFNARQRKVLAKVLEGLDSQLTSRKWAALAGCSQDTALRDITELLAKGVLIKAEHGGRSTHYFLHE